MKRWLFAGMLLLVANLTASCNIQPIRPPAPEAILPAAQEKSGVPEVFASLAEVQAATALPLLVPSATVSPTLTFAHGIYQPGDTGDGFIRLEYQGRNTTGNFVLFVDVSATSPSPAEDPILEQQSTEMVNVRNHIGSLFTIPSHLQVYYLLWQEAGFSFALWGSLDAATIRSIAEQLEPLAHLNGENAAPTMAAVQGAAGLGDKLFPNAGNGGYDVQHYDLDLAVDVKSNIITGTATMTVLATATLDTFNLDFHELTIDALRVNGIETPYQRQEDELVIDPAASLQAGNAFSVTIHYHGKPKPLIRTGSTNGWLNYFDRVAVENGALGAATWYPVNNHPLDRATYSFRVTVPPTYMALANGQMLGEERDERGWTTYRWATDSPMASSAATILIGHYTLHSSTVDPSGLLINTYVESLVSERPLARLAHTSDMLALLNKVVGPYPFPSYTMLIHTKGTPYADMRQELAIFSTGALNYYGEEAVMNGLAYQYFGQSVSIAQWQDAWLTEGLGGALGWLWIEKSEGPTALQTLIEGLRATYNLDSPPAAPTADNLESDSYYFRGPMAVNALRVRLGDERFFQLLRTVYARYRGGNVSTADFIAVAEEVSGEDLKDFFQAWLYADTLPPLPSTE